jgi:phosphate transport system substrate-binding protein
MNDDFLHHLREAPRPEFLAALKSRLDRQSRPARRPGFALGVLVGLLVAGAAFAFYLSRARQPDFAESDHYRLKATPLAPAWLPTHPKPASALPPSDTASAVGVGTPPQPQSTAPTTPAFQTFSFVATQQSLVTEMLSTAGIPPYLRMKTPHYSIRDSLQHLCDGTGAYDFPDMVELNRRITVEEYRTCTRNGYSAIVEQKLGYQAVVLVRGRLYGPLRLTARDVFLALARRVPDPDRPGELIDNPYTNWNQVDPALPPDRIKFLGPVPASTPGTLLGELLLTAGCNTYPWIAARYGETCQTLRTDGVYEGNNLDSWNFSEALVGEPTAIGIFGGLPNISEKLVLNPVDGIEPGMNTLASGTYPLARTLYLYLDKDRLRDGLVLSLVSPTDFIAASFNWHTSTFWAFVPLDATEREALRKDRYRFKPLQF